MLLSILGLGAGFLLGCSSRAAESVPRGPLLAAAAVIASAAALFARARSGRLGARLAAVTADAGKQATEAETAHQHRRELEAYAADLALANRDLQSSSRANGGFLRSVTHDLRTPFLSLQWFSGELVRSLGELRTLHASVSMPPKDRGRLEALDRDMEKAVGFLEAAAASSSQTLKSLQQLCQAGQAEYRREWVDVSETVRRIVGDLDGILAEKGAAVTFLDLPRMWGDASAVEQMFTQLLGNAVQYLDSARRGAIEVGGESGALEPALTYWVRDNGRGIPAASQGRLGVPFQRFHPDASAGEGIGLALVLCILERHGGRLRVESQEGVGTTVFLTLSGR